MLLIYYNPQKNSFYLKRVNSSVFDKSVGYVNQFNHVLIQIFYIKNNKFVSCLDWYDYVSKLKKEEKQKEEKKKSNLLINGISHLLNIKKKKGD